ncbi:MAG: hypothetical protein IJY12_01190 [Clostridia bacterium]|nr:hypothetical protein [Clostridia bacterium]
MEYTPKNENKKMRVLATVLFFGGLVCLILSPASFLVPQGYWQLAGMGAWCVCAYLLIRYVLTSYTYRIVPRSLDNEYPLPWEMDFTVDRAQGKRSVPMVRMSLEYLSDIFYVGDKDYRALPEFLDYRDSKVYIHTVNASYKNRYMAVFTSPGGEHHAILFEPDQKMVAYLAEAKKPPTVE